MAGFITRLFSRSTNGPGKRPAARASAAPVVPPPAGPAAPPPSPPAQTVAAPPAAPAQELSRRLPKGPGVFRWGPESGYAIDVIVVLCHGMGSNGENIIQIAPKFGTVVRRALFVAPNGPLEGTDGAGGRAWFDARDRRPAALEVGVRKAAAALNDVIDSELARVGLPPDAYALAGYSQGAMTALFTGLRRNPGPRAIFCYAGALIAPETLGDELANRAPVLLGHGLADTVVPAFYSRDAERALRAARVPVQGVYLPGAGHNIDGAGLQAGKDFFRRWLLPEPAQPASARRTLADG